MTHKEKFNECSAIERKLFRFILTGSLFIVLYFAVAAYLNLVSMPINLTSLALILIAGFGWGYWLVVKV